MPTRGDGRVNRRHFLQTATGLVIVNSSSVRGTSVNSALELGIIGSGGRGGFVGRLFREHTNTRIVALCDYFQDRVDDLGGRFQVPTERRYTGLEGYLRLLEGRLDAVAIESPPYFHPQQTVAALESGRHVFLAKPIAVDVPGCQAILDAARKSQGQLSLLVDFQTRADPLFREAASRVHRGDIGFPVLGHVYYHAARLKPRAEGRSEEARLRNWVFDKYLSGDIIVEQNIHVLDVANWYLNQPPLEAWGRGGRKARTDVGDCWDHFVVTYRYPDGVLIDFSSGQFLKGYSDLCIRLYGKEGTVDSHYGGPVRITGDKPWEGGDTRELYTTGAVNNVVAFHESILSGNYLYDTVAPSAESNLTAILGRMAAYSGRTVTWKEMIQTGETLDARLKL